MADRLEPPSWPELAAAAPAVGATVYARGEVVAPHVFVGEHGVRLELVSVHHGAAPPGELAELERAMVAGALRWLTRTPASTAIGVALDQLAAAAYAQGRAAALGIPHVVKVPEAATALRVAIEQYADDFAHHERGRARELRLRPLLEVLDQVLAHPDAHALSLESESDRAALRRLVAAAAVDHTPRRSS